MYILVAAYVAEIVNVVVATVLLRSARDNVPVSLPVIAP